MSDEVPEIKDPKAVLDALERAKADAKRFREELETSRNERASLQQAVKDLQDTVRKYEAGDDKWRQRAKELLVKGALGTNADRLMKFIDLDAIDFDEEDQITGLDDAVSKVKTDLPELFDTKRRVGGAADLFENEGIRSKLSGSEIQARRIFNK